MTRTRSLLCAAVLTLALLPSAADAQDGPAYARDREVTVTGTVADIKVGQNPWSNFRESHLVLKTETGDVAVYVGPTAFLAARNVKIRKRQTLQVVGSRINDGTTQSVLARESRIGEQHWTMRDESGQPLWGALAPEKPKRWTTTRIVMLAALAAKITAAIVFMG
jgi:hypothetical protein